MINNTDNRIIKLPKEVYDKIAAGEVIERPVSVVKELIENSIDAGANSILIDIKKGGKEYIRVTDNGCGMYDDEVELAFQRHATSKISTLSDLDNILTLGFRGEALSSIVSISLVELITKTSLAEMGVQAKFENGAIESINDIGCEKGTTIIIKDLFYNLPGRLKFLKPDHIEGQLIIDLVTKLALANSQIKFKLISNGKTVFSTTGNNNILHNIANLYDSELANSLLHYETSNETTTISVYFSNPSYNKSNRKYQIYFVNGRCINNKLIEKSINQAYDERIDKGRFPVVFLFFKIKPELIDVNIHPSKLEIKFLNEKETLDFIEKSIRFGLLTMLSIPKVTTKTFSKNENYIYENKNNNEQVDIIKLLEARRYSEDFYIKDNEKSEISSNNYFDSKEISKENISNIKVIGSIFNTYILGSKNDVFYIIDQHAAHERVLFDMLKKEYLQEEKQFQKLLIPIIINSHFVIKESHSIILNALYNLGFEIEVFGLKAFIARSIPIFMEANEAECFLNDFIDNINDDFKELIGSKIDKLISASCKSAVKAHDNLNLIEQERLIFDLSKSENPFSCPHGRPTILKLTISEIEKMFRRI
jgi:DNA mismatch repair protein MutL